MTTFHDSMWATASADEATERSDRLVAMARVACAGTWPFLAGAASPAEYEQRKALAADRLTSAIEAVAGQEPGVFDALSRSVLASLDEDFATLHASRAPARAVAAINAALKVSYAVGDTVYVDFGDSVGSGGEVTGKVTKVDGDTITVNGKTFNVNDVPHVEKVSALKAQAKSKSARDLALGDIIDGKPITSIDTSTTPGSVAVWTGGDTSGKADHIYNQGDPVTLGDASPDSSSSQSKDDDKASDDDGSKPNPFAKKDSDSGSDDDSKKPNPFAKKDAVRETLAAIAAFDVEATGTDSLVSDVMAWESGEMDDEQEATFFQGLIDSGMVWQLQGTYGRTAQGLIDAGVCHPAGQTTGSLFETTAAPLGVGGDGIGGGGYGAPRKQTHTPEEGDEALAHENSIFEHRKNPLLHPLQRVKDDRAMRSEDDVFQHSMSSLDEQAPGSRHPFGEARTSALRREAGFIAEGEYHYVKKRGDKWVILQKGTGKVLSEHDSEDKAQASFRAMMQSKHGVGDTRTCPECKGRGKDCSNCHGRGYIRLPKDQDAFGRPLMQPGDGHGAWACNNYDCTEHPQSMYPDFSKGAARDESWGSYQHGDTGEFIHMHRGNRNKTRFLDDDGNQVGPEHSNIAPATAWALSNGYFSPDLAAAGIFPDRKQGSIYSTQETEGKHYVQTGGETVAGPFNDHETAAAKAADMEKRYSFGALTHEDVMVAEAVLAYWDDEDYDDQVPAGNTMFEQMGKADPDGGEVQPTEADYAAFEAWAIAQFGQAAYNAYRNNTRPYDAALHNAQLVPEGVNGPGDGGIYRQGECPWCAAPADQISHTADPATNPLTGVHRYVCANCGAHMRGEADAPVVPGTKQAVNTDAQGADRYQRTPHPARPSWVNDEINDPNSAPKNQGGVGDPGSSPVAGVDRQSVLPSQVIRNYLVTEASEAQRKMANPYTPEGNPFTTSGPGNPSSQAPKPTIDQGDDAEQASPDPMTTHPRAIPGGQTMDPVLDTPAEVMADDSRDLKQPGGNTAQPGQAAAARRAFDQPQPAQVVANKIEAMTAGVLETNPGLGEQAAQVLAINTLRSYPAMVKIDKAATLAILDTYVAEAASA